MMTMISNVLHALRTAPFVTVVEIETLALQDECAYAVLWNRGLISKSVTASKRWKVKEGGGRRAWAVDVACRAFTGMVGGYRGC